MSRPQIGIDRLPVRRLSNNEPKEAMNCKSCRKRKIKCNRLRPCEACQVFNCACIYDAVPKKRGPKTDVLEALLKRVNGLEKRLKDEKGDDTVEAGGSTDEQNETNEGAENQEGSGTAKLESSPQDAQGPSPLSGQPAAAAETALRQNSDAQQHGSLDMRSDSIGRSSKSTIDVAEALLDTYFARLHGKPYYILDEPATRQRYRDGQLPRFLSNAIYATSVRYAPHLCGGHNGAVQASREYAQQSRLEIDVDEPSIDHLQALLLLAVESFQSGKGKTSYMLLSHAISMAFALSLHRELPVQLRIAPSEREGRRKLFWTCYLMDRFTASGSKRPALISDESICLRLPAWQPANSQMLLDGNYFQNGSSLPYASGTTNAGQGSGAMLVEIVRVLGVTNRYLAAGGVKGDSHFPWHAQSNLSKIRQDLDCWAANTQDAFSSVDALFGQFDSSTLVLSKLVYHLIHCLIYRPFLPVDLSELSGTGQHQSWQIEATNLCFLHANAIAELIEIGKNTSIIDWPSFVGYCICTAGTIHVHGAHYMSLREGDVFANSADFLSREMTNLSDLIFAWAGVQHQRETLHTVYNSHSSLVKSLASNPMRFSPVFQMEDFFDRYQASGAYIDGAHVTFSDIVMDAIQQDMSTYGALDGDGTDMMWMGQQPSEYTTMYQQQPPIPSQYMTQNTMPTVARTKKKRRTTNASLPYPTPHTDATSNNPPNPPLEPAASNDGYLAPTPSQQRPQLDFTNTATSNANDPSALALHQPASFTTPTTFSPNFTFSPLPPQQQNQNHSNNNNNNNNHNHTHNPSLQHSDTGQYDPFYGAQAWEQQQQTTPGGLSASADSSHTDPDKDPFLSLLEQLAENEGGGTGGPSDLDFFLNGNE
ncbi:hypothetical protein MBLNU230_g1589t1 [Neophaeotheca triangularis]